MDLQEFVAQSLVQIVRGVEQANKELSGQDEPEADKKAFLLKYSGGSNPGSPHVEFDVAISAKTDSKASAGAKGLLYVVGLDAAGSKSKATENISRLRFSVLVKEHQG